MFFHLITGGVQNRSYGMVKKYFWQKQNTNRKWIKNYHLQCNDYNKSKTRNENQRKQKINK